MPAPSRLSTLAPSRLSTPAPSRLSTLGLCALAAATIGVGLAGCGSGASSRSSAPVAPDTAPATQAQGSTTGATTTTTPAHTITRSAGATGGASAPASSQGSSSSASTSSPGLSGALATVERLGYTPVDSSDYHAGQTLRVLVGTAAAATGSGHQAFLFSGDRYLGTDTSQPSRQIAIVAQDDTSVTLAYGLYRPGASSPSTTKRVRFTLDNGRLMAQDTIPSASPQAPLSRR